MNGCFHLILFLISCRLNEEMNGIDALASELYPWILIDLSSSSKRGKRSRTCTMYIIYNIKFHFSVYRGAQLVYWPLAPMCWRLERSISYGLFFSLGGTIIRTMSARNQTWSAREACCSFVWWPATLLSHSESSRLIFVPGGWYCGSRKERINRKFHPPKANVGF